MEAGASARARESLESLQSLLHLPLPPARIEAYDISNIQGSYAVGAMTVLIEGLLRPAAYRRFVINTVAGSNDPAMLAEVLRRPLSHSFTQKTEKLTTDKLKTRQTAHWPLPDLIVGRQQGGGGPQ